MLSGIRSYYKRFETMRYSFENFGIFRGKRFVGAGGGPVNERDEQCKRNIEGQDFTRNGEWNRSDRLYISDYTHPEVFTQEIVNDPGTTRFNRYVQEWASKKNENKITNRGLDEKSSNYAAAFRIFATCPKGHSRWRHPDMNTKMQSIAPLCGEENLGGKHPPIGGE
jgi:hypothetical protein